MRVHTKMVVDMATNQVECDEWYEYSGPVERATGALAAAAVASAVVGAGSLGYGIYSGQEQASAQQAALKKQNTAQQTATAQALSTERQGEVAQGAANQKVPDLTGILKRAAAAGSGPSSTMLTGAGGAPVPGGSLGRTTLLGA